MVRVLYRPQVRVDGEPISYFWAGEVLTITSGGASDTLDFSGLPDGEASEVETVFPFSVVAAASRAGGVLSVELLNWIPEDASAAERFPEWQEVEVGG